jgi:hypothetical protein
MSNEMESKTKDLYSKFKEVIRKIIDFIISKNQYSFSQNHLFL